MAETFEAIKVGRSGFSQRVCLKLVLPFYRDSDDFIELFEREARLAAKLRHSNIVGIIDFGESEGTPYMALEYVDGVDLQALLDAQPSNRLSHELVAFMGYELAAALEHAHNPPKGSGPGESVTAIIHRDISPSNVLLSRHGEVLLGDFGVAKAVTQTAQKQSAAKGKVPYMSPEQLREEPLDGRADLFGLGVVLFEALGGQRPFTREHDPATIMAILKGEHPSLHTLAPEAPKELCTLIESLVMPERDARPDDATALLELLHEFVPPPRVKRELGSMVASLKPERPTPPSAAQLALEATAAQGAAKPDGSWMEGPGSDEAEPVSGVARKGTAEHDATSSPPRKRWHWVLATSLLLAGLAAGIGYWNTARRAGAPVEKNAAPTTTESEVARGDETPIPTQPKPTSDVSSAPVETPVEQTAPKQPAESKPAKAAPARLRPARLSVIVYPWGKVWINGKPRGLAPLDDVALKPGRYRVSAGQERPLTTQVIRLRSGETRSLTLDLTKQ